MQSRRYTINSTFTNQKKSSFFFFFLSFPQWRAIARKLPFRPHSGKSVAYRLRNAPFVFTRQRVDVTDVLSALSYDGLPDDVRAVRHFVSGGCRVGFEMIVSSVQWKTRLTFLSSLSRVSWRILAKWFLTVAPARENSIQFIYKYVPNRAFVSTRFKRRFDTYGVARGKCPRWNVY